MYINMQYYFKKNIIDSIVCNSFNCHFHPGLGANIFRDSHREHYPYVMLYVSTLQAAACDGGMKEFFASIIEHWIKST